MAPVSLTKAALLGALCESLLYGSAFRVHPDRVGDIQPQASSLHSSSMVSDLATYVTWVVPTSAACSSLLSRRHRRDGINKSMIGSACLLWVLVHLLSLPRSTVASRLLGHSACRHCTQSHSDCFRKCPAIFTKYMAHLTTSDHARGHRGRPRSLPCDGVHAGVHCVCRDGVFAASQLTARTACKVSSPASMVLQT
jgi:hypothetical protein